MDLATDATEANGNALANQEKYEESYTGKLQEITNLTQEFWLELLNSDLFKGILNELIELLKVLDEYPALFSVLIVAAIPLIDMIKAVPKLAEGLKYSFLGLISDINATTTSVLANAGANTTLTASQARLKATTIVLSKSFKELGASLLAASPYLLAIAATIGVCAIAVNNCDSSIDKAKENLNESSEDLEDYQGKLDDLQEKLDTLAGTDTSGWTSEQISESESRQETLQSEIDMYQTLIDKKEEIASTSAEDILFGDADETWFGNNPFTTMATWISGSDEDKNRIKQEGLATQMSDKYKEGNQIDLLHEYQASYEIAKSEQLGIRNAISKLQGVESDIKNSDGNKYKDISFYVNGEKQTIRATKDNYDDVSEELEQYLTSIDSNANTQAGYLTDVIEETQDYADKLDPEAQADALAQANAEIAAATNSIVPDVDTFIAENQASADADYYLKELKANIGAGSVYDAVLNGVNNSDIVSNGVDDGSSTDDGLTSDTVEWEIKDDNEPSLTAGVGSVLENYSDYQFAEQEKYIDDNADIIKSDKFKEYFDQYTHDAKDDALDYFNDIQLAVQMATPVDLYDFQDEWDALKSESGDVADDLLELAKSGELDPETIESTDDYKTAIDTLGLSAEEAANKIINLMDSTEQLSAAREGMESLDDAYQDWQDDGFVDAKTLESLPDVFKNLEGFDLFSSIVGDPTSTTEEIKQAFNDIATEYINEQDTLSKVTEENKEIYIANLKEMGVANAEEVVNEYIADRDNNERLLDQYSNYVFSKGELDEDYLEEVFEGNQELLNSLSTTYKTDYQNWTNSLTRKATAYNNFVNAVNASYTKATDSEKAAYEEAKKIVNGYENQTGKTGALNGGFNGFQKVTSSVVSSSSSYSKEEYDASVALIAAYEAAQKAQEQLQLDMTTISTDFGGGIDFSGVSDGSSSSSSSSDQDFDWIQVKIERLEREIENLDTIASRTWADWGTRNAALGSEIADITSEIGVQQQAAAKYLELANSVGLDEKWASLVRDGAIDYSTITDSDLADKIQKYQEFYENYLEALDKESTLQDDLIEKEQQRFENIQTQYENQIDILQGEIDLNEAYASLQEAEGHIVSTKWYENSIQETTGQLGYYQSELSRLQSEMDSDKFEYGTEAWYEQAKAIAEVKQNIVDAETEIANYEQKIRQAKWDSNQRVRDDVQNLIDENSFYIDLMDDEDLFPDYDNEYGETGANSSLGGLFSDSGVTAVGLALENYNLAKQTAKDLAEEVKEVGAELADDPTNTTLLEHYQDLKEAQQESAKSTKEWYENIKTYFEDAYNAAKDSIQEIVDDYKDMLQEEKDTYDYQKTIQEKAENISLLKNKLSAVENDNSEEGKARRQQIEVDLKEAQEDLQDTEYNQWISDQESMLDNMMTDMEEFIEDKMADFENWYQGIANGLLGEGSTIVMTMEDIAKQFGYTASYDQEENQSTIYNGSSMSAAATAAYDDAKKEEAAKLYYSNNDIEYYKKLNGYAVGSSGISKDQLAWTQENGTEVIYRKSDGAMLTPLGQGDKVFTSEQSQALWDLSNGVVATTPTATTINPSDVAINNSKTVSNDMSISISLPGVTNYDDFVSKLKTDGSFEKFLQSATIGQALGGNTLSKRRY